MKLPTIMRNKHKNILCEKITLRSIRIIFDTETGEALYGKTQQGYSDDSCWARGQAWGIYGFTLSYLYTGDSSFLETAKMLLITLFKITRGQNLLLGFNFQ